MSAPPLVSVVIPAYNTARYLPATIRSVLGQSYRSLEVVLVDDGSTDDTPEAVSVFESDSRFRYCCQPNGGAARARNRGVTESRGEFVAFLDADDLWLPQKLERQMPLFADPTVSIVYSDRSDIDENDRPLTCARLVHYRGSGLAGQLLVQNFVPMSSAVIRRHVFEEVGEFDPTLPRSEDLDFWLRVALYFGFDYVDEPLVLHRRWPMQLTHDRLRVFEASLRIQSRFLQEHPGVATPREVRLGWAKRYTGRGRALAAQGRRWAAMCDFVRALRHDIHSQSAAKELVKLFVPRRLHAKRHVLDVGNP